MTSKYQGINKVNDFVWVGGDPRYTANPGAAVDLFNRDFDLIIDARSRGERYDGWDEQPGLDVPVMHVPLFDDGRENDAQRFVEFWVDKKDQFPGAKKVFVHCHMGVNRGPSIALLLLMLEHDMSARDAFQALRAARPGVGVAYALQAVEAADFVQGSTGGRQAWLDFENKYWTTEQENTVRDRIRTYRNGFGQGIYTDDRGIDHITNQSQEERTI